MIQQWRDLKAKALIGNKSFIMQGRNKFNFGRNKLTMLLRYFINLSLQVQEHMLKVTDLVLKK